MKALILAGGFARRLRPLSDRVAKPLLEVGGRPVIDHIMERILELGDVEEVLVTVNRKFERQFRGWLASRGYRNIKLVVEESTREEEKPGAVASIARVLPLLEGQDCLIVAGDNLFTFSLSGLLNFYREVRSPVVGLYDVKNPGLARRYAVVKLGEEGRILELVEKPEKPGTTLIATCIYAMPHRALEKVREYLDRGGNRDTPGHFIGWLCKRVDVYGYVFRGLWFDVGTFETYKRAKREFPRAYGVKTRD